jgi:hypothetical protein
VAKFGHHLRTGHVRVGQHTGGVGFWGWCCLRWFLWSPPWLWEWFGEWRGRSAVEST